MARGFVWAAYVDDTGQLWAVQVDRDYAVDPDRGWFSDGVDQLQPAPRRLRMRHVRGIDESGRIQTATVAHVGAALWTGLATVFSFESTDGQLLVAQVLELVEERMVRPTAPA